MPRGINTCIKWSNLELSGLLEDEDNRVYFQRAKKHLGLHPFHLNDLNRALRDILDSTVNSYDAELQGLVLAYKNPKLLSPLGGILHDSYFIHVDIEADFYIFKPEISCVLKGTANKKAASHIGVLVHKAFNVSIPKSDDCEEWLGDYVFVGQEVKFTVTHLDFKGKLPFVRGELISDGVSHSTYFNEDAVVSVDREDKKEKLLSRMVNENGVGSKKKRSKKCRVIDSSGDEISDGDDKRKVFKDPEVKNRNDSNYELLIEKLKTKVSKKKRKVLDSSSDESSVEEERKEKSKMAYKRRRVNVESSDSESETSGKRKTNCSLKVSKVNGSAKKSNERQESPDAKPKVKTLKEEKTIKKKSSKVEESSDTSIEPEKSIDKKPKIKSLIVEKVSKKKSSKEDVSSDTSIERDNTLDETPKIASSEAEKSAKKKRSKDSSNTIIEPEELVDRKPIVSSLNVERSAKKKSSKKNGNQESSSESEELVDRKPKINDSKNKHTKIDTPESSKQRDTKFVVDGTLPVDNNKEHSVSDDAITRKKRSKKSRIIESDNVDTTEIEIKPEIRERKRTKSKKHKEEADKSYVDDEAASTWQNAGTFEFIKPEIKPEHKKKRRKSIAENYESGDASQTNLDSSNEVTSDFFRDIRIKAEPDPSDVEENAPREKSAKKKRKHSTIKEEEEEEENKTRKENSSNDETSYSNVEIKIEPDASDIEDSKPSKKKSKKRHLEKELFEDVKIKVEPDASDVEDSKPKSKLKSEPTENTVRMNSTT